MSDKNEVLDFSAIEKSKSVITCIQELSEVLKVKEFKNIPDKVAELELVIYDAYSKNKKSVKILREIKDAEVKDMVLSEQAYFDSQNIYERVFSIEIGDTVVTSKDMKEIHFTGRRVPAMDYWLDNMEKNLSVYELHGIDENGGDIDFGSMIIE